MYKTSLILIFAWSFADLPKSVYSYINSTLTTQKIWNFESHCNLAFCLNPTFFSVREFFYIFLQNKALWSNWHDATERPMIYRPVSRTEDVSARVIYCPLFVFLHRKLKRCPIQAWDDQNMPGSLMESNAIRSYFTFCRRATQSRSFMRKKLRQTQMEIH